MIMSDGEKSEKRGERETDRVVEKEKGEGKRRWLVRYRERGKRAGDCGKEREGE